MTSVAVHASNSLGGIPQRIVIRGTSKLSLKDRFARLSSELQQHQSLMHTNDVTVSAANKRLAKDLGNHPEVVAALHMQRKSVMQRLGVKARLGIPTGGFQQQRGFQQRNGFRFFRGQYRNVGASPIGRFSNGYFRPRNFGPKRMDYNRGSLSGMGFGRGGFRKRFRGGRGGGGRYGRGGGGRGGGTQQEHLSREQLDRQLDEYMAKTKAHLDNDLDVYMGETYIG